MSSLIIYRLKGACMKKYPRQRENRLRRLYICPEPVVERSVAVGVTPHPSTLTTTLFLINFKCFFPFKCLTSAFALASFLNFSMAWSIKTACMYKQQNTNRPPESIQLAIFSMCVFSKCEEGVHSRRVGCEFAILNGGSCNACVTKLSCTLSNPKLKQRTGCMYDVVY